MNLYSPQLHSSISVSQRTLEAQFLYHRTVGAICRAQNIRRPIFSPPAGQPAIHYKSTYFICIKLDIYFINYNFLISILRNSTCHFVYGGTVGAICRAQNIECPILNSPAREPTIQKLANYAMRASCILYKISSPYFIKVQISYL
jgi:hypothetical protein